MIHVNVNKGYPYTYILSMQITTINMMIITDVFDENDQKLIRNDNYDEVIYIRRLTKNVDR